MKFLWSLLGMSFVPTEKVDVNRDLGVFATIVVIVVSIGLGVVDAFKKR